MNSYSTKETGLSDLGSIHSKARQLSWLRSRVYKKKAAYRELLFS